MAYLFYLSAIVCCYSYFLYPLILMLIPRRHNGDGQFGSGQDLPVLSLIITVHNEAFRIRAKLDNTLEIEYPRDRLDIIVASDCSSDTTDSIVESYGDQGVRLVRADQRRGKEYAQLCAIGAARGDILVFSDVATRIPGNALLNLASRFLDARVGAVSSEDRFVSADGRIVGEGAYVRYEMWLRRLESGRAGLVGLSGSFFAARRDVCMDWDIHSPSDFNTALNCARQGLVAVTCSDVMGIYRDVKDPHLEYQRKLRTVIRGITAVMRHPEVLNPGRLGLFAFQVWSHKVMRWAVPWFLLMFAITTLLLLDQGPIYRLALALQLGFYTIAVAGWLSAALRGNAVVRIIFFFVQTNLALAQAAVSYMSGKRMTVWTPTRR